MSAKQFFEKLGYNQVRNDDDYIIYQKSIDNGSNNKEVKFCSQTELFYVSYTVGTNVPGIDVKLFEAISKQLTELGWI